MDTSEAIAQFGSVRKLAQALDLSVQAVYKWGKTVPPLRVYQIRDILRERAASGQGQESAKAA